MYVFFATLFLFLSFLKIALAFFLKELTTSVNGAGVGLTPPSKDGHYITLAIVFTSVMGEPNPIRLSHHTLDGTTGGKTLSSHGGA